jgi:hypothetical protein
MRIVAEGVGILLELYKEGSCLRGQSPQGVHYYHVCTM